MSYIQDLQDVIRKLHGVESKHVSSVPVKEVYQGQTVWDGVVEVFELTGHPNAKKAYAWSYETDAQKRRSAAVLHVPPIDSPGAAVRAAIVKEVRDFATSEKSRQAKTTKRPR
ncbi:MAG: hypothetical protein A3F68_03090 [Acidobacteria bacterium RIFCSPLOWO2_12_FULL_54_10]|nr:MAG: hypothetical protein A3F68_03090 [Acidobacteria bacterium RIFCSPLOWO2_12_FULL_54_10]